MGWRREDFFFLKWKHGGEQTANLLRGWQFIIYLFAYPFAYLFFCLFIYFFVYLFIYLFRFIYLFIYLFIYSFIYLFIYLFFKTVFSLNNLFFCTPFCVFTRKKKIDKYMTPVSNGQPYPGQAPLGMGWTMAIVSFQKTGLRCEMSLRLWTNTPNWNTPEKNLYQQAIFRDSFHSWLGGLPGVCSRGVL